MKKYFLIVVVFVAFQVNAQVANVHLSFGSTGVVYPTHVNEEDLISFSFWMVNTGNIPLSSSIEIIVAVEDSSLNSTYSTGSLGSFADIDSVLSPNDSIFIVAWDHACTANYRIGDNIVVIWPAAVGPNPITSDEFIATINVSLLTTVQQKQTDGFNVYPNPISETAIVKTQQHISTFKMIDILGNVVRYAENVHNNFMAIHKNELESGIYFIEIRMGEKTQIKKVIIK